MKFSVLRAVLGVVSLTVASHAWAETIGDALSKCSATENSLQRLVCYDRVVKDMNQYEGLDIEAARTLSAPSVTMQRPMPPQANPAPRPPVAATTSEGEFGLEHQRDTQEELDELTSVISELRENPYGKLIVTLSNGHVWQQTDDARLSLEEGMEVKLKRGFLSAFFLSREGISTRIRVKRIK